MYLRILPPKPNINIWNLLISIQNGKSEYSNKFISSEQKKKIQIHLPIFSLSMYSPPLTFQFSKQLLALHLYNKIDIKIRGDDFV